MLNTPLWVAILFVFSVIYVLIVFYITLYKKKYIIPILLWAGITSFLSYIGVFHTPSTFPVILLAIFPSFIVLIISLAKYNIKIERNLLFSTMIHIVRIPVEIILFQLYLYNYVPKLMTYEGRNFDIIIGISAVIVAVLYFFKKTTLTSLLLWNCIGLFFIVFILINATLSAPLPIQVFAFDQPNIAILYFPFTLLPAIIVPIVIYLHIRDILYLKNNI